MRQLSDPRVLESLVSCRAIFRLVGKQLGDEIFRVVRNGGPAFVVKVEMTTAHLFHDFSVTRTVERGHAWQENVSNDSCRPDITLWVIVLIQDFRSDVVRCAEFLVKRLGWIVNKRCAKIDYLYLVELFVLLKKDVLGFQISKWLHECT